MCKIRREWIDEEIVSEIVSEIAMKMGETNIHLIYKETDGLIDLKEFTSNDINAVLFFMSELIEDNRLFNWMIYVTRECFFGGKLRIRRASDLDQMYVDEICKSEKLRRTFVD